MRILFTPQAQTQFLAAIAYIRRENHSAARALRKKAEKILKQLERFPKSGRKIPEFPDLPYREVVIPPYRFFYRIQAKLVWIVAVWHGAQEPTWPK